jgi:hypothetical protein
VFLGRVVKDGEPLWLPEDTAHAIAWRLHLDGIHDGCGQPLEECMSPDAEGSYEVTALRCHACAEQERAAAAFAEGAGDREGLFFTIRRRGRKQ